jgi:hypothetical protein
MYFILGITSSYCPSAIKNILWVLWAVTWNGVARTEEIRDDFGKATSCISETSKLQFRGKTLSSYNPARCTLDIKLNPSVSSMHH